MFECFIIFLSIKYKILFTWIILMNDRVGIFYCNLSAYLFPNFKNEGSETLFWRLSPMKTNFVCSFAVSNYLFYLFFILDFDNLAHGPLRIKWILIDKLFPDEKEACFMFSQWKQYSW